MALDKKDLTQIEIVLIKATREALEKFLLPHFDRIDKIFESKIDNHEKRLTKLELKKAS